MSAADQIIKGAPWCLRSIKLPHGTAAQLMGWLEADPRPNAVVLIVKPPKDEPIDEVWFTPYTARETFRLPVLGFTERFQPVIGDPPLPEQVPPERPPQTHEEFIERRLRGW